MAVCNEIKRFSRTHETIADLSSLLAVGLLFASIWVTLAYYRPVLSWLGQDIVINGPLMVIGLAANAFLILGMLAVGSARFADGDERCFGTFRGRRSRHGDQGFVTSWVQHMENVGKRHR